MGRRLVAIGATTAAIACGAYGRDDLAESADASVPEAGSPAAPSDAATRGEVDAGREADADAGDAAVDRDAAPSATSYDFEGGAFGGTCGWNLGSSALAQSLAATAHEGSFGCRICSVAGEVSSTIASPAFSVSAGHSYRIQGWAMAAKLGSPSQTNVRLVESPATGAASSPYSFGFSSGAGVWTQLSGTRVAKSAGFMEVELGWAFAAGDCVFIDDIVVTEE